MNGPKAKASGNPKNFYKLPIHHSNCQRLVATTDLKLIDLFGFFEKSGSSPSRSSLKEFVAPHTDIGPSTLEVLIKRFDCKNTQKLRFKTSSDS